MASNRRSCDSSIMGDPLLQDTPQVENALEAAAEQQPKKRDLWAIAKEKVMNLVRDGMLRSTGATPIASPPATPISAAPSKDKGKGKGKAPAAGSDAEGSTSTAGGPKTPTAATAADSEDEDGKKTGSASSAAAKLWGKWKGKGKEEPEPKKPKQKDPLLQWFVDHSGGTMREPPPPRY
ncbi:hypothetical protein F4809DRAFT_644025 [Biscogniauxia mediterranea]|nr:hypothetical protein F4809DRAFT_644025 [Biscogniauxia mediterranea]